MPWGYGEASELLHVISHRKLGLHYHRNLDIIKLDGVLSLNWSLHTQEDDPNSIVNRSRSRTSSESEAGEGCLSYQYKPGRGFIKPGMQEQEAWKQMRYLYGNFYRHFVS